MVGFGNGVGLDQESIELSFLVVPGENFMFEFVVIPMS